MEITLQVPEPLGEALQRRQSQLIEILERGLESLTLEETISYSDETSILEILASRPEPEQVLAMQPSPQLQAKVTRLLQTSKQGKLSTQEEAELNRYLLLEHLIRLAKAHAAKSIAAKN